MRAAILVTGDEILRGRIQERNAAHLARSLEERGVAVVGWEVVGDDLEPIAAAVVRALEAGHDLVCVSGGLGPTHDDVTMEAVGRATGRGTAVSPAALEMVRARSAGITGDAAVREAVQRKQATLPLGAQVLPPPGTAPGCLLAHGDALVAVLPGPPWELAAMWDAALSEEPLAALLARAATPHERVLRIHGVPESGLLSAIRHVQPGVWDLLRVGICAREGELEVTVRSDPADAGAARALEQAIADGVGDALYSRDGAGVDAVVARALRTAGQTVAVAESCTGGGLGARLTSLSGSSEYVLGGVVAYADAVKVGLLGVDPDLLRREGAVSAACAEAMAVGARRLLGADWALSVTGVAGPGGGSADKPVGLVYLGLAGPGVVRHVEQRRGGDRDAVRGRAVVGALHLLRRALAEAPGA